MRATAFTASQLRAVDPGPQLDTCVVAGPGSGKTTVLVEYFQRLVAAGTDPLRILAITFTEKAAGNMRKKLAEAFRDDSQISARLERAWVSTVHGFCARLLRENAVFAGVDPEFYVADERESWRMQQESALTAVANVFEEQPAAMRALIRGLSSWEFEEALLSAYDAMRCAGMTIQEVAALSPPEGASIEDVADTLRALRADSRAGWNPAQNFHFNSILEDTERIVSAAGPFEALRAVEGYSGNLTKCKKGTNAYNLVNRLKGLLKELPYTLISELYQRERELLLEILRRFDTVYRASKRQAGALDFNDLEEYTVRLLHENPETRARLQGQFDHVLMDEFQDTNGQQARLIGLIRRPGQFYAVGDINQSIFGFRHAEPEVFRGYRDEVRQRGQRLIPLVENFRSRAEILRAVETIVSGASGIEPRELVAGRQFAEERPVSVDVIHAPTLDQEALWVARRILDFRAEAPCFAFREMAVLVRNTEVLGEFSKAFDDVGIPYAINRGKGFYDSREVKDLAHLLRVIANPCDEVSLAAVLRSPLVFASDEALLALKSRGDNLGVSLAHLGTENAAGVSAEDYLKLTSFRDRLREWRGRREAVSFDRLLLAALDESGYECEAGARGWANVDKFLAQAREAARHMPLDAFVEQVAQMRDDNVRERDAPPDDSADAVNVMTVHSAKGLEFPVVFVAALHKGIESSPPVVAFSRQYGLGARWRNPATGKEKDDLFQHAIRAERKAREEQESDRLLYVAMTRAEEHLVLSFSGAPKNWAQRIVSQLHLDIETPADELHTYTSPSGAEWKLRFRAAQGPPELKPGEAGISASRALIELVARPTVSGQQETNATVTALAAFARCPREYYLAHYLGYEGRPRKLEANGDSTAGEFGTAVHTLLAGSALPDPDPTAVAMAEVFRQSALGRRVQRATRLEREFDFLIAVEGLVLRGQIDLWFEEGGKLILVDYKTDSVNAMEAHRRAQDYAIQVRLYALAVERVTGRAPDHAWLHFLRPNTVIEVDLAPSLLESPEQMVRDFQEAQDALQFPLNEGAHCNRCQFFRDLCPAPRGGKSSRLAGIAPS